MGMRNEQDQILSFDNIYTLALGFRVRGLEINQDYNQLYMLKLQN